jgi:hypothetical protein
MLPARGNKGGNTEQSENIADPGHNFRHSRFFQVLVQDGEIPFDQAQLVPDLLILCSELCCKSAAADIRSRRGSRRRMSDWLALLGPEGCTGATDGGGAKAEQRNSECGLSQSATWHGCLHL